MGFLEKKLLEDLHRFNPNGVSKREIHDVFKRFRIRKEDFGPIMNELSITGACKIKRRKVIKVIINL